MSDNSTSNGQSKSSPSAATPKKRKHGPKIPGAPFGRPPKLNNDIIKQIVTNIATGVYAETAAAAAGIHKETFYDWLRKGAHLKQAIARCQELGQPAPALKAMDVLYVHFSDSLEKAMAYSEMMTIARITAAAAGGEWTAGAGRAGRMFPKKWGRRYIVEPMDDPREPDPVAGIDVTKLPTDKLLNLLDILQSIVMNEEQGEPNHGPKQIGNNGNGNGHVTPDVLDV